MKWKTILSVLLMMFNSASAEEFIVNYDEAKMSAFVLPELMKCTDGSVVKSKEDWTEKRRPELLALFEKQMFGKAPALPPLVFEVREESVPALEGRALRKQVRVFLTGKKEGPAINLLIYTPPDAKGPVPIFLGLNFEGNPSVANDPGIFPREDPKPGDMVNGKPAPLPKAAAVGSQSSRWQVEWLMSKGYGLATAWYWDIDPDYDDGFKNGVHALYTEIEKNRSGETWGSVAAWAWGTRAVMDYLEKDPLCNSKQVALTGHSRLGKAALWAGALDDRFSLVISNESGCGGAALSKRIYGETVGRINSSFPHWFCGNYKAYSKNEEAMPFDQHQLLALVAPRALFVGSAEGDQWADPRGEQLGLEASSPAFFLTAGGSPVAGHPLQAAQRYFIRPGPHDVMASDWQAWVDFAQTVWK